MLRKWVRDFIAVWASVLFAAPALAAVTYTFTSDPGDFTFISPSFFDGGEIPGPGGLVVSTRVTSTKYASEIPISCF
jgi:hypothetical protein